MTAKILTLRARKRDHLMECYRTKIFREMTERLQAEVAARKMREMDHHFTQMLAAALEVELAGDETLKVAARMQESF
jgi:hypothetical protein